MIQVHILKVQKMAFINYCYIVINTQSQTVLLIDPAWEPETITTSLINNGWLPKAVLLTHHHPDHVHLAPYFASRYNIPVYMGKAEIDYYSYSCPNLIPIISEDSLLIDTIHVLPIATPGHTYGGVSYLIGQNLFTGDTLFNEGCGMCQGKGADAYQMYKSLEKLKHSVAENTMIYPGHCYGLPIGQKLGNVLNYNIYLQFKDAESFVAYRMRKQQSGLFNFK
jgi:hydroxyacylglutathione hydrolase